MVQPSEYELKLLRHLWRHRRLSAREIHDASQPDTGWSYSATRKTLERMAEKGLVKVEAVHGLNTYAAVQSKIETLAVLASAFAREVLDSDTPLPTAAFAHSPLLSRDEIKELEKLLERMAAKPAGRKGGKS